MLLTWLGVFLTFGDEEELKERKGRRRKEKEGPNGADGIQKGKKKCGRAKEGREKCSRL